MRPGQAAPEFLDWDFKFIQRCNCFNEAGAGCPGIRMRGLRIWLLDRASMRPGQAAPEFIFIILVLIN